MTDDNSQQQQTPPDAMPWYRSKIIVGILTAVLVQVLARLKAQYHIDFSLYGVTADQAAETVLDVISAIAASIALHGRVSQKAAPPISLTKPPAPPAQESKP